ncbi:MAG: DUF4347 domain-containing protein [Spirulina sp. SIO3F2]|nr:DUF4347 domain-containing protein [Spirulina sp. SIO3F2]
MLKTALFTALPLSLWAIQPLYAQSITATPDGTGTIIQHQGNTYHIQGGTQAGANLFHSFQEFGLSTGEIANFLSNPDINNIFGRVIGGNASIIDGLIQANPNLYLMNPAGMVFGANASLNVGGDFFATTADRMGFENGWFNATGDNDYTVLVGTPNQFAFLSEQSGAILNFGDLSSSGDLSLVGGTVLNQGSLVSAGNVTIAAVPGKRLVNLAQDGMLLSLDLPQDSVTAGIIPVDLPTLLTGSGWGNPPVVAPNLAEGNRALPLQNSDNRSAGVSLAKLDSGDVVIAGTVEGEQVDLYAAGQVTPTDYELIQGDTTVVRFPEADGQTVLSIIDAHADNAQDLLFGGAAGTIATIVQDTENGIEVVSETLSRIETPLDGMSITAEGNEGNFWLGNTWITHETIADYQDQLRQWSSSFKASADLLLYSCFTALGETGEALLASLATGTGLDVAASVNATGSVNQGGDWVLERSTGSIETQNPFTETTLANWDGKLATFTVNAATQAALEAAIVAANGAAGADEIRFSGVTQINLTSALSDITEELTITGGGTRVTIAGNNTNFRIFNVTGNVATTFDNLTITGGRVTGNGGGINSNGAVTVTNSTVSGNSSVSANPANPLADPTTGRGGGINSDGAVTVTNSTVSGNSAYRGGGINGNSAGAVVTVTNSTVSGNSASGNGGGINGNNAGAAVTVTNSTVSGNSANAQGGGVFSFGAVTVTDSTVSGNSSGSNQGGGIANYGAMTVTNSTVSGNSANSYGGGILSFNTVTVTNSTVSSNSANRAGGGIASVGAVTLTNSTISGNSTNNRGGGVFSLDAVTATNATIAFNSAAGNGGGIYASNASTLNNTIVSNNSTGGTGPDLFGTFTANFSLILNPSGATISGSNNIFRQDPLLQALANNGGSTQTHALQAGSPAINGGNNALVTTTTDQRGGVRIFSGTVDIGAYEFVILRVTATADFETQTERLTAACRTIPKVELESEQSTTLVPEPDGGPLERNEQCQPVTWDESERN